MNRFTLSHDFVTCRRSPEISSTAFDAQPPDLPPVSLMDMGFAIMCSLARHRRPHIRFLFIGSPLSSPLPAGPPPRPVVFRPLASVTLLLHQTRSRTFTSYCRACLTHTKIRPPLRPALSLCSTLAGKKSNRSASWVT